MAIAVNVTENKSNWRSRWEHCLHMALKRIFYALDVHTTGGRGMFVLIVCFFKAHCMLLVTFLLNTLELQKAMATL